jgi:PAS domain S-box-containing protein
VSSGIAVLSVSSALIVARVLDIYLVTAPVSLFLCAIMASAWFGGTSAGWVAVALSHVAFDYYFVTPIHSWAVAVQELPRVLLFSLPATFVVLLSAAQTRATESLRRSDGYLREAQRLSRTGSFGWTASSGDILWSEESFRIFDYDRTTIPTVERLLHRVHPEDAAFVQQTLERAAQEATDFEFERRLLMPDGSAKYVHVVAHAVSNTSGGVEFVGAVMDVTESRRVTQELEDLAGRLIGAQEEERRRIGRELHDHISQMLGILAIRIDQLRADGATAPHVATALDALRRETSELTDDVHRLSRGLHSSTLDYLGLVPALQKLVADFSERHNVSVTFAHAALPPSLPSEVALCLFRIAEEGLANIAKHSQARSASVEVIGAPDGIHLRVEDAGTGFDMTAPGRKAGLGLVSMQERLRLLHGTIRVESTPSRGTTIDAWVPPMMLTSAGNEAAQRSETA